MVQHEFMIHSVSESAIHEHMICALRQRVNQSVNQRLLPLIHSLICLLIRPPSWFTSFLSFELPSHLPRDSPPAGKGDSHSMIHPLIPRCVNSADHMVNQVSMARPVAKIRSLFYCCNSPWDPRRPMYKGKVWITQQIIGSCMDSMTFMNSWMGHSMRESITL